MTDLKVFLNSADVLKHNLSIYMRDGCCLVEPPLDPEALEAAGFECCGDGFQGLWAFSPMGFESVCGGIGWVVERWSWCIWIRLKQLSIWMNSFFPPSFPSLCFSTSKSIAMRDLKVFERGYWKSLKANCFQHDYPASMGVNTAASKNARTRQNLRISA